MVQDPEVTPEVTQNIVTKRTRWQHAAQSTVRGIKGPKSGRRSPLNKTVTKGTKTGKKLQKHQKWCRKIPIKR